MSSTSPENASSDQSPELPPLAPAVRKKLHSCYEHSSKLMSQAKYDFDYAHTLLLECVVTDPGNHVFVQAFLTNLSRKYDNNKKGARMQFLLPRGAFKKAMQAQDWLGVFKAAPEILKINPWDLQTLRGLASACEYYSLQESEFRYLKMALEAHGKDVELLRHAARSLGRTGQFDQAITMWGRVKELVRDDEEADRMASNLQIEKMQHKGGLNKDLADKAKVRRPVGQGILGKAETIAKGTASKGTAPQKPAQPEAESEQENDWQNSSGNKTKRDMQLTHTQQLERAIVEEPGNLAYYMELAVLYVNEGRPANAERVLAKALSISGNDLQVQERLEEVQILKTQQQVAIAEKQAMLPGADDEDKELAKQAKESLFRLELDIYSRRAERHPTDARWRYEIGVRLKKLGNYSEAAQQFVTVQAPSPLLSIAQLELGECWQQLKQYAKAMLAYKVAISEHISGEKPEVLKLALYRGAVLGTALKDKAAEGFFTQLLALDPKYKDAQSRLDKLRLIGHNT